MSSSAATPGRWSRYHRNPDAAVLAELRRTRQVRRLGEIEWFDVAYRVYLFALAGLIGVVMASDAVGGLIGDDVTDADLLERGPSIVGLAVAVAFGVGLRSGANGGPVSIELADIRHVLLSPVDRGMVMRRPIAQRLRAAMFGLSLPAAAIGQLVAREVAGSRVAWAGAAVLFGSVVGAVYVSAAVLAHAARMPRWLATALSTVAIGWQAWAAWSAWSTTAGSPRARWSTGPADLAGNLAFWGIRQPTIDYLGIAVVAGAVVAALTVGGRLRIEWLTRRGRLVSQLRFAATVQDIRTVVMLRRQLRAEAPRTTPWFNRPVRRPAPRGLSSACRSAGAPTGQALLVWKRGIRSLRRLPVSRLGRIAGLAVGGGVSAALAVRSTPLFLVPLLAALFLLGMETLEPLSQEVDRPDLTDGLPVDRGWLYAHHLVASAVLISIAALLGAAASAVVEPAFTAGAFAVAIPVALAGAIGPTVATVLDAPPAHGNDASLTGAPKKTSGEESLMPPEFAGFGNAVSTLLPVTLSAIGLLPVVAMDAAPTPSTAIRVLLGTALVLALTVWWVRRRDSWGRSIRAFFEAGRVQQREALQR